MSYSPSTEKRYQHLRHQAMGRFELGTDGGQRTPRKSAAGHVSPPIKLVESDTRKLIDEAIAARRGKS